MRKWAQAKGEIYVVTGPVLTDGPYKKIGQNEVSIPKRFYKVILDYKEPELKAIGFIIPNQRCPETLGCFAYSVREVEEVIHIDLFHNLPDEIEDSLETKFDISLWEDLKKCE